MKRILAVLIVLTTLILFISCPEPLTEDVVLAAEDSLVPTISVISPSGNDPYYSEVEFSLEISDDAKSEGDGKGDIASIEFSVSNDDFRGGKIDIRDGSVTQDDSAGPDEISYDSSSGICSFSFSTVDPNPLSGYISVTVTATDQNGNATEEKVSLTESEGPWVDFSLVDADGTENMYVALEDVFLSGTVGDSTADSTSDSEIYSINWTLAGSYYEGTLILDEDATYEDPYNGNAVTPYYIESENLYRRSVDVLVGGKDSIAQPFEYNPSTRTFQVNGITIVPSLEGSGAISLNLVVTDKNGHETESTVLVSENTLGPVIYPYPVNDASYSHFSTEEGYCEPVSGEMNASTGTLSYFRYSLFYGSESVTDIDIPMGAGNDFSIDYYSNLQSIIDTTDLGTTAASGTTVNIQFEAAYDDGRSSSVLGTIALDNDAPDLSGFSFKSNYGDDGKYANENSTVTYSLTVSDDMGLIDDNELTIDIVGPAMTDSTTTTDGSGDVILTYSVGAWCNVSDSDVNIPYTITVADRLGNSDTYVYADGDFDSYVNNTVMYYDSSLIDSKVSIALQADSGDSEYAKAGDSVTLTLTTARDLLTPDWATIDGVTDNSVTKVSDTEYTASVAQTEDGVENRLMSVSVPFTDMAGNSSTATMTADTVYYDSVEPVLTAGLSSSISGTGVVDTGSDYYLNENMNNVYITVDGLAAGTQDLNLEGIKLSAFNDSSFGDVQSLIEPSTDITVQLADNATLTSKDDGGYTAYVQLVDKAGNVSESNYEVPFYIDTEDPTLTLVEFMSNNSTNDTANTDYAKLNDHVWVTFTATDENGMDNENGYTITINGVSIDGVVANTAYDESDITSGSETGTQNTCTLTLVTDEVNKTIPFSIEVKDNAGNAATLTQDNTASTVTYYSRSLDENYIDLEFSTDGGNKDGDDNCYVAYGENFYLYLTTSRDLEAINGTFNGNTIYHAALDGSVSVPGSCSFSDSRIDSAQEEITFDFTGLYVLTDKAGNTWSVSALPSGDKLYYDSVPPVLTGVGFDLTGTNNDVKEYGGNWYINEDMIPAGINIQLTGLTTTGIDEYLKGVKYMVFNGSMSSDVETGGAASFDLTLDDNGDLATETGAHSGYVRLVDWAGNTSVSDLEVPFIIDKTEPSLSYVAFYSSYTNSQYAKVGDTVYVTFESSDDLLMDSSGYSVTINGGATIYDSELGDQLTYKRVLSVEDNDKDLPFSVTVEDAAGNTSSISTADAGYSGNTIRYYSKDLDTAVSFSFTADDNYGSDYFAAKNDNFKLTVISDRDLEDVNGLFNEVSIGPTSFTEGDSETYTSSKNDDDTEEEVLFSFTGANTLIDKAGNEYDVTGHPTDHLYYDSLSPSLSSVSSDYPGATYMIFDFSELLVFSSAASSAFTLSPSVGGSTTGTSPTDTITITGTYTDGQSYTLGFSGVTDRAGNSMSQSTYTINNNSNPPTSSGIGNLSLFTLSADDDSGSSGSSGSSGASSTSGSYKQRSGRMTAELRTVEEVEEVEERVALSTEMKSEIQDEMKSVKTKSLQTASGTVQTVSARVVNRPDLNTGMEALSRAMEQVEKNKADYQAMLDDLSPDELSTDEMLAMNSALEPEIYEPLTMTVSASPLVSGAAREIEVSLNAVPDEAADEKTGRYVALKVLIALMGVMLTAGFLYLMKRLQN